MKRRNLIALLALTLAFLLPACNSSGGTANQAVTFRIGGQVVGLQGLIRLLLNGNEEIQVAADGSFQFATGLADGAAYTVTVSQEPAGQTCTLAGASGTVGGDDVADIRITCVDVANDTLLAQLSISLPQGLFPVFDPATTTYDVAASIASQRVRITATAQDAGASVTVDGDPVASGTPSAPIELDLGLNEIDIVVTGPSSDTTTYTVRIDRTNPLAQINYVKASNAGANDRFCRGLSMSGDTIVVGASGEASGNGDPNDDSAPDAGAVYVFRRVGSTWMQEAYIKAPNIDAGDEFGRDVDIDGDLLVVGAPGEASAATGVDGDDTDNSAAGSGAVYVYRRTGSTWTLEAYLKASNAEAGDSLGIRIAVCGDTVAAGASGEDSLSAGIDGDGSDNGAFGAGAAYVFRRNGSTWAQEAYIKASNPGIVDNFGFAIDICGDLLVVGANGEDSADTGINGSQLNDAAPESGAAYVFRREGTTWTQEAYIKASNADPSDFFGTNVAMADNVLVVGAFGEDSAATGVDGDQDDNSVEGAGAAYVFRRTGTTWAQEAYLKASNPDAGDRFGARFGIGGNLIVIGAPREDGGSPGIDGDESDNSIDRAGAAYVYRPSGGTWVLEAYVKASNPGAGDVFGDRVAISDDTIVLAAYVEDSGATGIDGNQTDDSAEDAGALYIFE